jgi:hypothetical protein
MTTPLFGGRLLTRGDLLGQFYFPEDMMEEKFIIVCTVDGDTTSVAHSSQKEALHQAEKLLREHGCDLEITLHMDDMSSSP